MINKNKTFNILANNLAWSWISRLLASLIFVVLTPIIISQIGRFEYGVWVTFSQILVFVSIADLGIASSLGRNIVKNLAERNEKQNNELVFFSILFLSILSIFFCFFAFLFSEKFIFFFEFDKLNYSDVLFIYKLVIINFSFILVLRIGRSFLISKAKYYQIDIANSIHKILIFITIIIFVKLDELNLVNLTFVFTTFNILLELYFFTYLFKNIHLPEKIYFSKPLKNLLDFSFASFLKSTFGSIRKHGLIIICSIFFGFKMTPLIAIPIFISSILSKFFGTFATSFFPFAVKINYSNNKNFKEQKDLIFNLGKYSTRYILGASVVISMLLYTIFDKVLIFWLDQGNVFSQIDYEVIKLFTILLLFSQTVAMSLSSFRTMLFSIGYHWFLTLCLVAVTTLMYSFIFFLIERLSIKDLIYFLVVNILIVDFFIINLLIYTKYKNKFFEFILFVYTYPFLILLGNLIFYKYISYFFNIEDIKILIMYLTLFLIINLWFYLKFCLINNHKKLLKNFFHKKLQAINFL